MSFDIPGKQSKHNWENAPTTYVMENEKQTFRRLPRGEGGVRRHVSVVAAEAEGCRFPSMKKWKTVATCTGSD